MAMSEMFKFILDFLNYDLVVNVTVFLYGSEKKKILFSKFSDNFYRWNGKNENRYVINPKIIKKGIHEEDRMVDVRKRYDILLLIISQSRLWLKNTLVVNT